jgi:hypothetical protein
MPVENGYIECALCVSKKTEVIFDTIREGNVKINAFERTRDSFESSLIVRDGRSLKGGNRKPAHISRSEKSSIKRKCFSSTILFHAGTNRTAFGLNR